MHAVAVGRFARTGWAYYQLSEGHAGYLSRDSRDSKSKKYEESKQSQVVLQFLCGGGEKDHGRWAVAENDLEASKLR